MASSIRRYTRTPKYGIGYQYGTSDTIDIIRKNMVAGNIQYREDFVKGFARLDVIAGEEYGDATLYWIIAACSGIGWGLQVPPGTKLCIPQLSDIVKYI